MPPLPAPGTGKDAIVSAKYVQTTEHSALHIQKPPWFIESSEWVGNGRAMHVKPKRQTSTSDNDTPFRQRAILVSHPSCHPAIEPSLITFMMPLLLNFTLQASMITICKAYHLQNPKYFGPSPSQEQLLQIARVVTGGRGFTRHI